MGLDVVVGVFGEFDEDECAEFAEDFAVVRRELSAAGLPSWQEPRLDEDDVVLQDMLGYSGLHHLRRVAAHLAASGTVPAPVEENPADDPVLKAAYAGGPAHAWTVKGEFVDRRGAAAAEPTFDHLIQHSDCEGYYVPVDFAPVLISDDVLGGYVGSSQRLLEECLRVAEALDLPIDLDPDSDEIRDLLDGRVEPTVEWQRHGIASLTCLQLIEAAWHSIDTGAAIAFC
ncbi:hypothetical protein [Actinomadura sp. HBU206391]|uniref:hypothetical protein n=1 Tax=Actinomadura sp. HBU206391 TaxID=2731692 RepID=UPI00164FEA8D|nr:hypothetical protein [Actinomadura sp. HBU206391]MBC6462350.1 hypothetical protein [Actinomadura sp. HBU206391]